MEKFKELARALLEILEDNIKLKAKIDKAIEYLKTFHFIDNIRVLDVKEYQKLLEILGDKENVNK